MLLIAAGIAFSFCPTGGGVNCVVDGDTIWFRGEKIRILNIDAPETHRPKCPSERALGDRATDRLFQLINGKRITLVRDGRDKDRNGRLLRRVEANGRDVGERLVKEGLARRWEGKRRPWCSGQAGH